MVIITGSAKTIGNLSGTTWLFLILSGLATGASWLCYFKALQLGDINKVVPYKRCSYNGLATCFCKRKTAYCKREVTKSELAYICLSGIATGGSWLCYYKALQDGPASAVVPIDKLSLVVSIVFSYIVFKEKLSVKSSIGLVMIIAGTLVKLL